MSGTQMAKEHAGQVPTTATVDLKLEVVVLPVSDVERAKGFYESLGYTVFGEVTSGMDVVDRIVEVPTGAKGSFSKDAPLDDVVIRSVRRT